MRPAHTPGEEPGALYLRVRIQGRHGAVLARESSLPAGGVIAHAGPVTDAIDRWCAAYARSATAPGTQVGPAAGIGSLTSGRPDKPDLFSALLEAGIDVVTVPGAAPAVLVASLRDEVEAVCASGPLAACTIEVDMDEVHPAATPADAPIVRAARAAWRAEFGADPPPISGWTGSTASSSVPTASTRCAWAPQLARPRPIHGATSWTSRP